MNNVLTGRYHALKDFQKKALRDRLHDSPKALVLIDFLEKHPSGKFSMNEVVDAVYNEKEVEFSIRQNRFFKLRKKLFSYIESPQAATNAGSESSSSGDLLPLEAEYYRCREHVNANHFTHATRQLQRLYRECEKLNVFELMPQIISNIIYCKHALNESEGLLELSDEMDRASALLHDLQIVHSIHHRFYSLLLTRRDLNWDAHMKICETIAQKNSAYPRFRLFQQFIMMNRGPASRGLDNSVLGKSIRQFEKLLQQYPDMPVVSYEKHHRELTQYYLAMAKGIYAFSEGDAETCYRSFLFAWEIIDATPGFRVRKTESLYVNKLTTELATGRNHEAIKTAEELLEFHRLQKDESQRVKAYSVLAMVYTHCFKQIPCPNPDFILGKIDEYIRIQKKAGESFAHDAIATKAIFLFMMRRFSQANRIVRVARNAQVFHSYGVPEYIELLKFSPATPTSKVNALRQKLKKQIEKNAVPGMRHNYQRAIDLLDLL